MPGVKFHCHQVPVLSVSKGNPNLRPGGSRCWWLSIVLRRTILSPIVSINISIGHVYHAIDCLSTSSESLSIVLAFTDVLRELSLPLPQVPKVVVSAVKKNRASFPRLEGIVVGRTILPPASALDEIH